MAKTPLSLLSRFLLVGMLIFLLPVIIHASTVPEHIFRESSTKPLAREQLLCLSPQMLELARNEIFARHGLVFKRPDLKDYFRRRAWYRPDPAFKGELASLSGIEQQNVMLIRQWEKNEDRYTWRHDKGWLFPVLKAEFDLDGDGRLEQIEFIPGDEKSRSYPRDVLKINGVSLPVSTDNPWPVIHIVDLDYSDNCREIWLQEMGPSDDYASSFYRWKDGLIIPLGKIGGVRLRIDGSGKVLSRLVRGWILHTWFREGDYEVGQDQKLRKVHRDLYTMNTPVTMKAPLALQRSRTDKTVTARLKPGDRAVILASDDRQWCLVRTASGTRGWFAVDGYDRIRGTGLTGNDLFEGLCYAD